MKRLTLILLAVLVLPSLAACSLPGGSGDPTPTPVQAVPPDLVVTLERTACFGACPIYKVEVHADGTVKWNGERFVKTIGPATSQITQDKVRALVDAFEQADYFSLNDAYNDYRITDMPSANTSIHMNGRFKVVGHYYGDNSAPDKLKALEDKIDEIAGTAQWIGSGEDAGTAP